MERYCLLSRFILSARVNQYHDQLRSQHCCVYTLYAFEWQQYLKRAYMQRRFWSSGVGIAPVFRL